MNTDSSDTSWNQLKLSLERPYKDDNGQQIPTLLDITQEGELVYEPKEDPVDRLGENLRRIFQERGLDYFTKDHAHSEGTADASEDKDATDAPKAADATENVMTPEELYAMRAQLMPHLYIAFGEMTHARDLLAMLLSTSGPSQTSLEATLRGQLPVQDQVTTPAAPSLLTAAVVTKTAPIVSVQVFNAQLTIGAKDEALRKAASILKAAAESVERGRLKGESYWVDALKIRRANWGLVPTPLPPGQFKGRGADLTSKDFLVSFGLEESAPLYRQKSIGYMANPDLDHDGLVFPFQQNTRLQVTIVDITGDRKAYHNTPLNVESDLTGLDGELRAAQREMAEREIFSVLVKEAANLPTAASRVSERLIVIDAAQGVELRFELVDTSTDITNTLSPTDQEATSSTNYCNLIYSALHILLLRTHNITKAQRLKGQPTNPPPSSLPPFIHESSLLQPIVDILQYRGFCNRVHREVALAANAVADAGVDSIIRFTPLCELGEELVGMADGPNKDLRVSGEAVLRIDQKQTLRFTFSSPSTLTAHLTQATLTISSIPQLCQLLSDEVEHCLLNKISSIGSTLCEQLGVAGTWFVDPVTSRSVGRWEGCALNFCVTFGERYAIKCSAVRVERNGGIGESVEHMYDGGSDSFKEWTERTIKTTLGQKP